MGKNRTFARQSTELSRPTDTVSEKMLYESWLQKKVNESIAGVADSSNRLFTKGEWAAIKAERAADRKSS